MSYTSGPWNSVVSTDGGDIGIVAEGVRGERIVLAEVFEHVASNEDVDVDANADIIAAAPQLLEACQAALDVWSFQASDRERQRVERELRYAIDLAMGK